MPDLRSGLTKPVLGKDDDALKRRHFLGAAALTAAALRASTGTVPADAATPNTLIFGDSYTEGVGASDPTTYGWAYRVAAAIGATKIDGKGGSGYANPTGYGAGTYVQRLWRYPTDMSARRIIIQGSSNDLHDSTGTPYTGAQIGTGINQAWKLLVQKFPNAKIIVLGNCNPYGAAQDLIDANDRLRRYAGASNFAFIDPIGWFSKGDGKTYANPANGHPNDAGHQLIADRFRVEYALL